MHEVYEREPHRLLLGAERRGASDLVTADWLRDYRRFELVAARTVAQAADTLQDRVTRGKALLAQQAYEEALREFQGAIQRETASFVAWFCLGYAYGCLLR
jgi:hypothetical protein